jgi:transposase InsO family protein
MKMAYTISENLPRVRAQAVRMVRSGTSTRKVARHFGYSQSAVVKWCKRAGIVVGARIETGSSRPHHHPRELSKEKVRAIIAARKEHKRCSEIVHEHLRREGVLVSLSSVKRTLNRYRLLKKRSPWKKTRRYPPLPDVKNPGDLVQFDTVHLERSPRRYVYTALDVYSRYGFAMTSEKANCGMSVRFLKRVMREFPCRVVQTDNGFEFGLAFSDAVQRAGALHRHIHPHSPNENGHLERFNRTLQEEPFAMGWGLSSNGIEKYLVHYNEKRLHLGLKFKTPREMLKVIPRY